MWPPYSIRDNGDTNSILVINIEEKVVRGGVLTYMFRLHTREVCL